MNCPNCKGKVTVRDTVHVEKANEIYRKRKCTDCGHTFFTVEFEVDDDDALKGIWAKNYRTKKKKKHKKIK